MGHWQGKTVLVTGASSGIGRATALAFAEEGANLVLAARRREALDDTERAVRSAGVQTLVTPADVTDPGDVQAMVAAALERFGTLDVLVANAGTYLRCDCRDLTVGDIESVMAVNFYGCVRCVLEALPHMLRRGQGHLVVVSSVDGRKGIPPDGAYVASKFALTGFADVLRQELHGTGVRVTTVYPGRVDTPMIGDLEVPGVSAKIPASRVATAIVRAVTKGRPEVYVPLVGSKALVLISTLSPRLGDSLVRRLELAGSSAGSAGATTQG